MSEPKLADEIVRTPIEVLRETQMKIVEVLKESGLNTHQSVSVLGTLMAGMQWFSGSKTASFTDNGLVFLSAVSSSKDGLLNVIDQTINGDIFANLEDTTPESREIMEATLEMLAEDINFEGEENE